MAYDQYGFPQSQGVLSSGLGGIKSKLRYAFADPEERKRRKAEMEARQRAVQPVGPQASGPEMGPPKSDLTGGEAEMGPGRGSLAGVSTPSPAPTPMLETAMASGASGEAERPRKPAPVFTGPNQLLQAQPPTPPKPMDWSAFRVEGPEMPNFQVGGAPDDLFGVSDYQENIWRLRNGKFSRRK